MICLLFSSFGSLQEIPKELFPVH
uniref:Uncharacterized protein n=1 Tax=Anguilla anguilla TaxID=7936 RepID=A0A0E9V7N2_ANGAN